MNFFFFTGISNFKMSELALLNDVKNFHQRMPKFEAPVWEMLTPRKIYSFDTNAPEIGMLSPTKDGMNIVLGQTMAIINEEARKVLHRTLEFKRLNHGYRRYHPLYGMQYMLDLLMKYHRHIGRNRRRMTVHVRHHAYLQQPFGNLIYAIEKSDLNSAVNFILPLAGRMAQFERFMENYENVVLKGGEKATLLVLYFTEVSPAAEHVKLYERYRKKYPEAKLNWIEMNGQFSRSLALTMGASQFHPNSLLFFCDVDVAFTAAFLERCRRNTVKEKQVYYPIVFSQYAPEVSSWNEDYDNTTFRYSSDIGFWRLYGFGITCQYRTDFDGIGGFDTTIQGWGMEDVQLYDRYVLSEVHTVFRAADPGLVHIYHEVSCDKNLQEKQLTMCYASKARTYGSQRKLYEVLNEKGYLKNY